MNTLEGEFKGALTVSWKSYLIREKGVTVFDDYIASHFERANEQEEGIAFNPWKKGTYPTWGMPALKASKAVALQGDKKWKRFHLAVMKAFYTDGRDISSEQVLEEIAEKRGLTWKNLPGNLMTRSGKMLCMKRPEKHKRYSVSIPSRRLLFKTAIWLKGQYQFRIINR